MPKTQSQSQPQTQTQQQQLPAHEEIAGRAYQLYLQRGSGHGQDIDDWLAAEQELARERVEAQPSSRRQRVPKPEAA
jgi:DUF2934 family protein